MKIYLTNGLKWMSTTVLLVGMHCCIIEITGILSSFANCSVMSPRSATSHTLIEHTYTVVPLFQIVWYPFVFLEYLMSFLMFLNIELIVACSITWGWSRDGADVLELNPIFFPRDNLDDSCAPLLNNNCSKYLIFLYLDPCSRTKPMEWTFKFPNF